jgi:hypothetical protein
MDGQTSAQSGANIKKGLYQKPLEKDDNQHENKRR